MSLFAVRVSCRVGALRVFPEGSITGCERVGAGALLSHGVACDRSFLGVTAGAAAGWLNEFPAVTGVLFGVCVVRGVRMISAPGALSSRVLPVRGGTGAAGAGAGAEAVAEDCRTGVGSEWVSFLPGTVCLGPVTGGGTRPVCGAAGWAGVVTDAFPAVRF